MYQCIGQKQNATYEDYSSDAAKPSFLLLSHGVKVISQFNNIAVGSWPADFEPLFTGPVYDAVSSL